MDALEYAQLRLARLAETIRARFNDDDDDDQLEMESGRPSTCDDALSKSKAPLPSSVLPPTSTPPALPFKHRLFRLLSTQDPQGMGYFIADQYLENLKKYKYSAIDKYVHPHPRSYPIDSHTRALT